ncbi:MAG: DMT family transporter [Gemmatimonadaceae bacterium]
MATTADDQTLPRETATYHVGLTDVALLAMATIWGVNYSVIKFATRTFTPLVFNGLRIPLAAGVQLAASRTREPALASSDRTRLVVLGMLGNGVYQVLFILGIARTRVATAALLMAATPALIAVFGWWHGSERVTARSIVGIALQLLGVLSVVAGAAGATSGSDSLFGVALVLLAAAAWAAYAILIRPYAHRVAPLQLGGYTMLGGALVAVVAAVPTWGQVAWRDTTPLSWAAVAYSGAIALVVAYLFWYRGVRIIGPTRTSMYSNLQPLIAMLVAWLALGERPTPWQLLGAVCIMAGLVLARSQPGATRAPSGNPD